MLMPSLGYFHTPAWFASLGNVVNADVAPVPDPIFIQTAAPHFLLPMSMKLIAAYASGSTLNRARFRSPNIVQYNQNGLYIRPINQATLPGNNTNSMFIPQQTWQMKLNEELIAELTTNAAGPARSYVVAWLQAQYEPIPPGDEFKVRFTSVTAAVPNVWTQLAITLENNLPVATYAVTGLEVQSANAIAARLIFQNQQLRPGVPSINTLAQRQFWPFYGGGLGVYGKFETFSIPNVEVLCDVADAAHEGYLSVVRIG